MGSNCESHIDGTIFFTEDALLFNVEILEDKFSAVAGEYAQSAKIIPLQNFALYDTK